MNKFRLITALAGLTLAGIFVQTSAASIVYVGNCPNGVHNITIQQAVNASGLTGTIDICPGTYPEQVTIIGKNLTLSGIPNGVLDSAVITAPTGGIVQNATGVYGDPIAAQIFVQNATVNINHLTVDGANNQINGCAPDLVGIYYQNSGGIVNDMAVRNQALSASLNGCQSGLGILSENGTAAALTLTIENSNVQTYQKNGITVDGAGTTTTISNNYVVGQGPTTGAAENGIQVSDGATGTIKLNDVVDDVYSPSTVGASGILIYDSGSLTIHANTVSNTQFGIVIFSDGALNADDNTITNNHVTATHLDDGIDLCSNGNTATGNFVYASDGAGIHIDSTCTENSAATGNNTHVTGNTINEACAGVLLGSGTGSSGTPNTYSNVPNTTQSGDVCTGSPNNRHRGGPSPLKR